MTCYTFQLYQRSNADSAFGYPFIAISPDTDRVFYIDQKSIDIDLLKEEERRVFDQDYQSTPQQFTFNMKALDTLITSYIGQAQYLLTVYSASRRVYLSYRSRTDDQYYEVTVSGSEVADAIAGMIHKLLWEIKERVFKKE